MYRYAALLLLPAALLLAGPSQTRAQYGYPGGYPGAYPGAYPGGYPGMPGALPGGNDLSGGYVNQSNGGECSIYREGRSYVFVNENGSQARFLFDAPGHLRMVAGDWDGRTGITVQGRDRFGRMVIRFDSTGRPGFWVQAN